MEIIEKERMVVYDKSLMQLSGDALCLASGRILCTRSLYTDGIMGNIAHIMISDNFGKTWNYNVYEIRSDDPKGSVHQALGMVELDNGDILLPYMDTENNEGKPEFHPRLAKHYFRKAKVIILRSKDKGDNWERYSEISTLPYIYPYGKMTFNKKGTLFLPCVALFAEAFGRRTKDLDRTCVFFMSNHSGRSWEKYVCITKPRSTLTFTETSAHFFISGDGIAISRISSDAEPRLYQSFSHDDGETWTEPKPTGVYGQSPCLFDIGDGVLLLAYRSSPYEGNSHHFGLGISITYDRGTSWREEIILRDPLNRKHETSHEVGMPIITGLPDGRLWVQYYSYNPKLNYLYDDPIWQKGFSHCFYRYLAATILEIKY